jgi:metal-responsive CopG/Arc/MetJ family transcriptional regulator
MKRVTVNVDDKIGAEAEAIAEERGVSVSQFYAEAVEAAIREHNRQQALQRIEDEVMGTGAPVSREEFDEAQRDLRKDDSQRR